jgi:putative ABC transport system ATP-binding protein
MTLSITALSKRYGDTTVFANVSLTVQAGEFVAIVGESGVGKSTLLNCMAGLDSWDAGSVQVENVNAGVANLGNMSAEQLAVWRRMAVGFVFQAFHVLPHLDVAQNIGLPLMLLNQPKALINERVAQMLAAVGLDDLGARLPQQLSGGQLQRVAIARALVHRPALVLADEPTGNLDPTTAAKVMDTLIAAAAARADRVLHLTAQGIAV